jgi:hypothetical protein
MTEIIVGGSTKASDLFLQDWEIFISADPLSDCRLGVAGLQGFGANAFPHSYWR